MISIITITYNAERFLARTISSIVAQQGCVLGADYEYIIVDGASKDGTMDIIRQYEKQLTRWVSEPDRGLYDAMDKGMMALESVKHRSVKQHSCCGEGNLATSQEEQHKL